MISFLIFINIVAFGLMWADKSIAARKPTCNRVSEIGLLLPFLFGGVVGGYMGMVCCKFNEKPKALNIVSNQVYLISQFS